MRKPLLGLMAALSLASSATVQALQVLPGEEGKKHVVKIPMRELTRIAVDNQRLAGFRYKLDELEVDEDKKAGVVYIQPLVMDKQISVFVASASGMTHELVLQPTEQMPLESIVIREPAMKSGKAGAGTSIEKAGALEVAVKRLVLAMARGDAASSEYSVEKLQVPLALWTESRFVLVSKYTARAMTGEGFKLMNVSAKPMRIAEQELYKPGVVAVVVESQVLRPGEETDVFIVRTNK